MSSRSGFFCFSDPFSYMVVTVPALTQYGYAVGLAADHCHRLGTDRTTPRHGLMAAIASFVRRRGISAALGSRLAPRSAIRGRHDIWNFYQDDARLWCWTHTDEAEVRTVNKKGFISRTDCIADAMKHGYLERPATRNPWAFSVQHDE